jgi:uncharacterized protein YbaR (Trm112 family)
MKYCEIEQVQEYIVVCPYCQHEFRVNEMEHEVDFDLELTCPLCKKQMLIPDF